MYWLQFIISAVVIVIAGIRLTVAVDKLSDELNLGKVWIGAALLGMVTSLPEAITSLTAMIALGADDLAVGNLLGSNNFNPMLIVVMDVVYRQGSVTDALAPNTSHRVSARYAILLTFLVIVDILINGAFPALHAGPLSIGTTLIAVLYFVGIRKLAKLGTGGAAAVTPADAMTRGASVRSLWVQLAVSTVFVVGGAMWLAGSADAIAAETGLGRTFVGSIFLAIVTSLPEMVVSLAALRLGSLDLAVGNIFGSNMANMFILSVCSLFHRGGPLLAAVAPTHMFTAAMSLVLVHLAMKGIAMQSKKTFLGFGWDSLVMAAVFLAGTYYLYHVRSMY